MAQDFSSQYLQGLRFPRLPALHLRIGAQRVLKATRWLERRMRSPRPAALPEAGAPGSLVSPALESGGAELRSEGWAFFEDILEPGFHADIQAGWPQRCYLTPASDLLKSWDRGFGWRRGQNHDPPYIERHVALRRFLDELRSEAFGRRFTALVGAEEPVSCYSFVVTATVPGSVVAPHRDDWAFLEEAPGTAYNLVFFIDGSGGPRSGGLAILRTNTFDDVIFASPKLRNTALIYDTKAPFYHGFEPVQRGKFRRAIISNFVSSDFRR